MLYLSLLVFLQPLGPLSLRAKRASEATRESALLQVSPFWPLVRPVLLFVPIGCDLLRLFWWIFLLVLLVPIILLYLSLLVLFPALLMDLPACSARSHSLALSYFACILSPPRSAELAREARKRSYKGVCFIAGVAALAPRAPCSAVRSRRLRFAPPLLMDLPAIARHATLEALALDLASRSTIAQVYIIIGFL